MKILLIWGHKERPWGYEVRVDLQDEVTGRIYNEALGFALKEKGEEPTKEEINKAIDARIEQIIQSQEAQAIEAVQAPIRQALEDKGELLMAVSKGLLKAEDVIAELEPYKTDIIEVIK